MSGLDPRWEWVEITKLGQAEPRYVKAHCNHLPEYVVKVTNVGGELVARLCTTCDTQFTVVEPDQLSFERVPSDGPDQIRFKVSGRWWLRGPDT